MALTYVKLTDLQVAGAHILVFKAQFATGYPTGGEPVLPADLGLYQIDAVIPSSNSLAKAVIYDAANRKLKVATTALTSGAMTGTLTDGTVAANAVTNLAVTGTVTATGAGGVEVANASDQSALTATLLVIGR